MTEEQRAMALAAWEQIYRHSTTRYDGDDADFETVRAALSPQPEIGLVEAVTMAAKRFRFYEQQHRNKTPPDTVKAENNSEYAEAMEQALQSYKKQRGGS